MTLSNVSTKKISLIVIGFVAALGIGFIVSSNMNSADQANFKTKCEENVICVDLFETGAVPAEVAVELGKSVQFNAKGSDNVIFHLATKDEQGSLHADHGSEEKQHISSGDFSGDEAWQVKFDEVGSIQFVDENNPAIEILVVVYEPGAENKIQ